MSQPAQGSTLPGRPADDVMLAALVERARAGDVAAFTALYERFYVPICRYLARLVGDDELGNDLAQDTFLAAWRALPGTEDSSYFVPWLYRIASNLARSHLRRARLIRWLPWGDAGGYHLADYSQHCRTRRTNRRGRAHQTGAGGTRAEASFLSAAATGCGVQPARNRPYAGPQREKRQRLYQPRAPAVSPGVSAPGA